jgi:hypothetical protein
MRVEDALNRAKLYNVTEWGEDSAVSFPSSIQQPVNTLAEANVFSSELKNRPGYHAVQFDLDLDAVLVPSSTPGHHHLLIDHVLPWGMFAVLLDALAVSGVVQRGYVESAMKRQGAMLRLPWVRK